jgi:hypothetical protein
MVIYIDLMDLQVYGIHSGIGIYLVSITDTMDLRIMAMNGGSTGIILKQKAYMITRILTNLDNVEYYKDDVIHRTNGPARTWFDGVEAWYLFGEYHRYYGPQDVDGSWWLHGDQIK